MSEARLDFDTIESFMRDVFVAAGVPPEDAAVCADVLVTSDKRGINSHGISRLKPIYIDRIVDGILSPTTEFEIVRETPTVAVVDGHNGMGHVIAKRSMQMAIDKAAATGLGMVVCRNSTHYGIAGYYGLMGSDAGMIGITGTNARPSVAPTFGVENMLGTNALTFAMPSDEDFPFVLDCATSLSQRGKIEVYDRLGIDTPEGWVIGEDGTPRTDTHQILEDLVVGKAALTPLGGIGEGTSGHKGYGYSVVVEILSSALQAGNFLKACAGRDADGNKCPIELGHFFLAIQVEAFIDLPDFKKAVGDICRELRASRLAPGEDRIYTAGEKEHLAFLERSEKGVPISESLQAEMLELRERYGLTTYEFPF